MMLFNTTTGSGESPVSVDTLGLCVVHTVAEDLPVCTGRTAAAAAATAADNATLPPIAACGAPGSAP